jgi:hypothetical protein
MERLAAPSAPRVMFSTVPSVFNFFLTKRDTDDFLTFMQRHDDTYGRILFVSLQFVRFVSKAFTKPIVSIVNSGQSIDDPAQLLGEMLDGWKAKRHLCTEFIPAFRDMVSTRQNKVKESLLGKMFVEQVFRHPQVDDRLAGSLLKKFRCSPDLKTVWPIENDVWMQWCLCR